MNELRAGGPRWVCLFRLISMLLRLNFPPQWVSPEAIVACLCRQRRHSLNIGPFACQVFAWVWGRRTTFWEDFLRAQGETGLEINQWRVAAVAAEARRRLSDLFPGETFDEQRELTFTHPRTGFVVGTWCRAGANEGLYHCGKSGRTTSTSLDYFS